MKHFISAAILAAATLPTAAQLHEELNVEGTYLPDIIMLDRIHLFPSREALSMPVTPLTYSTKGVAASFSPEFLPMPATAWQASRAIPAYKGYLELGAGSWLNSTLSAGWKAIDSRYTKFGVRLQHNSTSLWKPKMSDATADTRRMRYDENLGLYFSHVFPEAGTINASATYHAGYFNYYAFDPWTVNRPFSSEVAPAPDHAKAPTQTLNDFALKADWRSESRPSALDWNAAIGLRHFAYRALWLAPDNPLAAEPQGAKGDRETRLDLSGGVVMPWGAGSSAGIDAAFSSIFYADRPAIPYSANLSIPGSPAAYAHLSLTPFYRFTRGRFNIKAGFDLDLTFNADGSEPDSHYSLLHFAPEINLDWRKDAVGLYLHLTGGSELQTLASGYELDYYQLPVVVSTQPVHSPLDARLGALFGPFSGFSAGLEIAYRVERHRRDGGWYMTLLDTKPGDIPSGIATGGAEPLLGLTREGINIQGFSLGADLSYSAGRYFSCRGSIRYQPQRGTTGFFNGYDRPRIVLGLSAESNPWSSLKVGVDYNYRGVRNIYTLYHENAASSAGIVVNGGKTRWTSLRLPDITNLALKASYDFRCTIPLHVWLQADNILGQRAILLPGLPSEGATVTAGFQILF